jgi:hypothetical protein
VPDLAARVVRQSAGDRADAKVSAGAGTGATESKETAGLEESTGSEDDFELNKAANELANNMIRSRPVSGKFNDWRSTDVSESSTSAPATTAGLSSLSSLGALPSLSGKSSFGVSSTTARTGFTDDDDDEYEGFGAGESGGRTGGAGAGAGAAGSRSLIPAEFDDESEEMYDFQIPTNNVPAGATAGVVVGGGPTGAHSTIAAEEPPAGAALLAIISEAELQEKLNALTVEATEV